MFHPAERLINYLLFQAFNLQTAARSWEVAKKHYDLGNELFSSFLDSSMSYSCGYWKDANNLEEAQLHKMEMIARKLKLSPGMRVLDIGCGWGSLCKYLAEKHGVQVVGITVSKEGAQEARKQCKGLDVEIRVQDYRDVNEGFDRIVAVEMLMHVGRQNYKTFFQLAHRCLSKEGILFLHVVGIDGNDIPSTDQFTNKYIFPNTMAVNHKDIPSSIDNLFSIEDWHSFGQYFDNTFMAWHENFVKNWHTISHLFEDPQTFYRQWTMFLLFGAAIYRSRRAKIWQIVLTKRGYEGEYISVR
jgi:cyclopropane-fatty-acyl-phospholipid synthase